MPGFRSTLAGGSFHTARTIISRCAQHASTRIVAGGLIGSLTVAIQTPLLGDAPIHFAPSLVTLALAALYLGYQAGLAALASSAALVYFALLRPQMAWPGDPGGYRATFAYVVIALVLVAVITPLHRRVARFEECLNSARQSAEGEAKLREAAEADFQLRLSEMQTRCEKVLDLAQSAASIGRYADSVAKRLSVLNAVLVDAPSTAAFKEDENGVPIIRAAWREFIDLTGRWMDPGSRMQKAMKTVVKLDGSTYPKDQHPLAHAAEGRVVYGQRVGWLGGNEGRLQEAAVYAASAANGRVLAVALALLPDAAPSDSDPTALSKVACSAAPRG